MMSNAAWQLQTALITNLKADANLLILLGSGAVFDEPARQQALPYIVLEVHRGADWSTSTEGGSTFVVQVRIWSSYLGRKQILEIAEAVEQVLVTTSVNLADYHLINLRVQNTEIGREQDGRTYLSVLRFRAVTEPI
ncbi:MAG: hypothetical protein COA52_03435 [Hyphomicrobiales bacterium]|nr:DUF3168 domain-containing protein [Hyphomicrobiales bacterium]PCJ95687.1 MAG: hypothetical protein COA52_03435 [Hyphomicrobiales bacterium]